MTAGMRALSMQLSLLSWAFAIGLCAAGLSYLLQQARWWLAIHFLFMPLVVVTLSLHIPPLFFLGAFLLLWVIYWNTYRTQVPLYLSSNQVWHALEAYLPPAKETASFSFIDLGSGLGGILTHLAKVQPKGRYHGIESAPFPYFWSKLRIRLGGYRRCRVYWGSFWDCNLAHYDIVFAYLSPAPMTRLWKKAKAEMRPGTVLISSTFAIPDQTPSEIIAVNDLHQTQLLIWRM
jgi:hypothetical protein